MPRHFFPTHCSSISYSGGADLSGILAVDDDDDDDDDDGTVTIPVATTAPAAAATPSQESAGFMDDDFDSSPAGEQQGSKKRGRQLGSAREAAEGDESEGWDSDTDEADSRGLKAPLGGGGSRQDQPKAPTAAESPDSRSHDGAGDSGSGGSVESSVDPMNASSPRRPVEEGSDWDGDEGRSSDDDEGGRRRPRHPPYSGCRDMPWSKAAAAAAAAAAAQVSGSGGGSGNPSATSSPPPSVSAPSPVSQDSGERSDAASTSGDEENDTAADAAAAAGASESLPPTGHGHRRRPPASRQMTGGDRCDAAEKSPKVTEEDAARKTAADGDGGSSQTTSLGTQEIFPAAAAAAATAVTTVEGAVTIESLRAEVGMLREHVLRSERKREAQLRDLGARLEAQERRRESPAAGGGDCGGSGSGGNDSMKRPGEAGAEADQLAVGVDEAVVKTRCRRGAGDGVSTPQGVAVHNPFAGTGGGAGTTPRDHFPAFEDALLDGGDGDDATPRGGGGDGEGGGEREDEGEEGNNKSGVQSEAFDFSIDTLSHINNHTDFGTDAPVTTTAPPAATAATSPKIGRGGGRGRGLRGKPSCLPWVPGYSSAPGTGGRSKDGEDEEEEEEEEDGEEVFDAKDAAAEEAFFSDACATASLQTPVKHLLATAASGPGFARRKKTGAQASTPARRRPPVRSVNGENKQRGHRSAAEASFTGRTPRDRESFRSCGDRALSLSDPQSPGQSPGLCMADFFARASAEAESEVKDDGGGGRVPAERGPAAAESRSRAAAFPQTEGKEARRQRSAAVVTDAGCQTTWSFSAHDEVRFVSIPPSSARIADGRGRHLREAGDGVGWSGSVGGRSSKGSLSSSGGAIDAASCAPCDGELLFFVCAGLRRSFQIRRAAPRAFLVAALLLLCHASYGLARFIVRLTRRSPAIRRNSYIGVGSRSAFLAPFSD